MRVFRRRADNIVQLAAFGGLGLLIAAVNRTPGALVVGGALVALGVRAFRTGVFIDDAGVTVRNTFRTHRVPWDDYERLDIGRAGWPSLPALVLRRRSGRAVPMWCIQTSVRGQRTADRLAGLLRDLQEAVRSVRAEAS